MAVAAVGEDDFVWCENCDYAANIEAARDAAVADDRRARTTRPPMEKVHTPDLPGIAGVAELLGRRADRAAEVHRVRRRRRARARARARRPRGQRVRARRRRSPGRAVRLFDRRRLRRPSRAARRATSARTSRARRSSSPTRRSRAPHAWVTGANEADHHVARRGARPRLHVDDWADLVDRRAGDPCPRCGAAAVGRPRHRGRPRLPARHQVLRGARRATTPTKRASSTRW